MKIGEFISKSVVDTAIQKSENVESLVTILLTTIIGGIVASAFSKAEKPSVVKGGKS